MSSPLTAPTPDPDADARPALGAARVSVALWAFPVLAAEVVCAQPDVEVAVLEPTESELERRLADDHDFDVIALWPDDARQAAAAERIVRCHPPRLAVLTIGPDAGEVFPDSATLPWDVWCELDPSLATAIFTPLLRSVREREALEGIEAHRRITAALDGVLSAERDLGASVADAMTVVAAGLSCDGAAFWRPSALGRSLIRVGCTGPDPQLDEAAAGDDRRPPADCDRLLELAVVDTPSGEVLSTGQPRFGSRDESSLILPARANGRVCGVVVLSGAQRVARRRTSFELALSAADRVAALVQWQLAAQQFKAVTARSPLTIILTDARGLVISYNEAAAQLCGVPRDRALEAPVFDLLAPASRMAQSRPVTELARQARDGEPARTELAVRFAGAPERLVELLISAWGEGADRRYALIAQDISARRAAERRIAELAYTDGLSGLPNQSALVTGLQQSERTARGLIALDVCRFDRLVQMLGAAGSDAVVRALAARLREVAPAESGVYHLSRAQFVVAVGESERARLIEVAGELCAAVARPLHAAGAQLYLKGVSGVSALPGDEPASIEVLDGALRALTQARDTESPQACFYDPDDPPDVGRLRREVDLHAAVHGGQLRLHYQPIVDLADGRVLGYEALARWAHPELGLLGPHLFIDLAEQNGLIVEIGRWVIAEACRQHAAWTRDHGFSGRISVNVAPRQLLSDDFAAEVLSVAGHHGVDPRRLVVEVVESAALADLDSALDNLARLRAGGVAIALDDFGVGESSLGRLAEIPVDLLKLDRSLSRGLVSEDRGSRAVLRSAILLGHELEIGVISEGIESAEQRDRLRELGCAVGQGYLFARPEPPEAIVPPGRRPPAAGGRMKDVGFDLHGSCSWPQRSIEEL